MSMSLQERLAVNNPVRDWFMRGEMAAFRRLADLPAGATVLDMGCGRGTSVRLILSVFGGRPARLVAFDIDVAAVEQAGRRLAPLLGESVELRVADATRLPFADGEFDAALELGILHHIPDWRVALCEAARVLKPGGVFYFAAPSYGRIHRGMYRLLATPTTPASPPTSCAAPFRTPASSPTSASTARRCGTWWAWRDGWVGEEKNAPAA